MAKEVNTFMMGLHAWTCLLFICAGIINYIAIITYFTAVGGKQNSLAANSLWTGTIVVLCEFAAQLC